MGESLRGKCLHDGNSIYAHMCMVYIYIYTHTHHTSLDENGGRWLPSGRERHDIARATSIAPASPGEVSLLPRFVDERPLAPRPSKHALPERSHASVCTHRRCRICRCELSALARASRSCCC